MNPRPTDMVTYKNAKSTPCALHCIHAYATQKVLRNLISITWRTWKTNQKHLHTSSGNWQVLLHGFWSVIITSTKQLCFASVMGPWNSIESWRHARIPPTITHPSFHVVMDYTCLFLSWRVIIWRYLLLLYVTILLRLS
jgi:hypothetical protein